MIISLKTALTLGILLRVVWMLLVDIDPVSDSAVYDEFAKSLVEGRGFAFQDGTLTAFWPVGSSAIYACLYWIFGYNYLVFEIFHLIVGCSIIWLGWLVSKRFFDEEVAGWAALTLSVWPLLIEFTTVISSELFFILILLISLQVSFEGEKNSPLKAVIFGVVVGLGCYIKPILAPMIVIIPVVRVLRNGNVLDPLKWFVMSLLAFVLTVTPWSYRNSVVFGEFTTMTTNFGPNLWMGNNPNSDGSYMPLPQRLYTSEKDRENQLKSEAVDFIKGNPGQFSVLAIKRLIVTFSRETIGVGWNKEFLAKNYGGTTISILKVFSTGYWILVFLLALIGVFMTIVRMGWKFTSFVPLVVSGYLFTIPLIIVGQDRYHMPMIPLVALFAGVSITSFVRKFRSREVDSHT